MNSHQLRLLSEELYKLQTPCRLCPRLCEAERDRGVKGFCGGGNRAKVFSWGLHQGEEPPLVKKRGSGTVFFSDCSLRCIYCQNHHFSQEGQGGEVTVEALAGIFLELQAEGASNLNLVTATHYLPETVHALSMAVDKGFDLPVVWNTSGYERLETVRKLEGITDVWLTDMRYGSGQTAEKLSGAPDYVEINRTAVKEMFRQTGHFRITASGRPKGVIIRHLALPGELENTRKTLQWIAENPGRESFISFMGQYYPAHKTVSGCGPLSHPLSSQEYEQALSMLFAFNLENGWVQDPLSDRERKQFLGSGFKEKTDLR